jgi:hypothetical protein
MSIRSVVLSVLLSVFACTACYGDWLVLRGGQSIETEGRWGVARNLLSIHEVGGRPKMVLLSVVDYDATLRANRRTGKARDSAWHISPEGIKLLQETSRQQEAMAARMRAQQEMSAELHSVESKPGAVVGGGPGQAQGKSQAQGSNGGYSTRGFQGLAACKDFQDSPSAYSSCLSRY